MIIEIAATFKQRTLIVVHIVAYAEVEAHVELEVLPVESGEDVSIEVGVGVTDNHLVVLVDDAVTCLVHKLHITGSKGLLVTGSIYHIEVVGHILTGYTCFSFRSEDAGSLVAIELTDRIVNSHQDIVGSIH